MTRRRLAVSSLLLLFVAILAVYCSQTVQQQSTETKPAWLRRLDNPADPSGSDTSDTSDTTDSTDATTTDSSPDGSGDGDPTDVETEPPAAGMADAPAAAPTEPSAGAPTAPAPETTKAPAPETTQPTAPTTTESPAPKTTNPPTTSPTNAAAPTTTNPPTTSPTKAPAPKATDPPVSSPTEDATDSSDLDTDTDTDTGTGVYDNTDQEDTHDYSLDAPTDKPVTYVPPDDDPVKDEDEDFTGEATDGGKFTWNEGETPEEMAHDPNVAILVGVLGGVALLLMIITAQQMLENPDGFCASLCRLLVSCNCCIFRTICPCLACCCRKSKRGHLPMMTDDNDFTHDLELS